MSKVENYLNYNFTLDKIQEEYILTNLDDIGSITCFKLSKIAKLINKNRYEIVFIIKSMGISIINCQNNFFKKLRFNTLVKNSLKMNHTGHVCNECELIWQESQNLIFKK